MCSGERLCLHCSILRLSTRVSSEGVEEESELVLAHLRGSVETLNVPLSLLSGQYFQPLPASKLAPGDTSDGQKHTQQTHEPDQ